MSEHAQPRIVMKMACVFFKWTTSNGFDFRKEIKNNFCRYRYVLKMMEIVFSLIDIYLHSSRDKFKNVDLNICFDEFL